jgi:23S rRNA pseudoU1915 N3-methylase RlmH
MAKTYLDRVPSFVDTEMKEIFPRSENANEYADKPRQMKDPSKEVMMQKDGKVIVVDKDKEKEYMSKGYELAETLDEGVKDWARNLAAAGIIVGAVAGLGSINNAIDNSVPAIQAMNTALELAQDQGNTDLADMIKKDIRDAKLRLDIGKDLNQVKYLQDKYSKFMPTEGLAYESKLAVLLNQHLK